MVFALTGTDKGSVRVEWKGTTHHAADALLAAPANPEERSALEEAMEFLRDALKRGPVWSTQVKKDTRKAEISEATLRRAKTALGVRSQKEADDLTWSWVLSGHERAHDKKDDHHEHVEPLSIGETKNLAHLLNPLWPTSRKVIKGMSRSILHTYRKMLKALNVLKGQKFAFMATPTVTVATCVIPSIRTGSIRQGLDELPQGRTELATEPHLRHGAGA